MGGLSKVSNRKAANLAASRFRKYMIKQADVETLMRVPGITEKNARAIREYFG